jgi:hypothetical protein
MRIAQLSAKKDGFGRPFFCRLFWVLVGCMAAQVQAQDTIYRCGQEYTNAPQGKAACVRVAIPSAVTVIEGKRPSGAAQAVRTTSDEGTALVPSTRTKTDDSTATQRERDVQARAILLQELDQAQRQQAQLQQAFKDLPAGQAPEKVTAAKAAIERKQRDIDSLQRELSRRPLVANP